MIEGFPRRHIKRVLNTMINAVARLSAPRAIANDLGAGSTGSPYAYAQQLMEAIQARHPQFDRL